MSRRGSGRRFLEVQLPVEKLVCLLVVVQSGNLCFCGISWILTLRLGRHPHIINDVCLWVLF